MATTTFTVTTEDGTVHTRSSKTKAYTHAVVTPDGVLRWSESEASAAKYARTSWPASQGATVVALELPTDPEVVEAEEVISEAEAEQAGVGIEAAAQAAVESLAEVLPIAPKRTAKKVTAEPKAEGTDPKVTLKRVKALRKQGMAWWPISAVLNDEGITTPRGGQWHGTTLRSWAVKQGVDTAVAK